MQAAVRVREGGDSLKASARRPDSPQPHSWLADVPKSQPHTHGPATIGVALDPCPRPEPRPTRPRQLRMCQGSSGVTGIACNTPGSVLAWPGLIGSAGFLQTPYLWFGPGQLARQPRPSVTGWHPFRFSAATHVCTLSSGTGRMFAVIVQFLHSGWVVRSPLIVMSLEARRIAPGGFLLFATTIPGCATITAEKFKKPVISFWIGWLDIRACTRPDPA